MNRFVQTPGTLRPMLALTAPVLVEQMLHLFVGLVDMWLTGNLLTNEAYVAAMTLVIYSLWLIGNLFSFIAVGSTALAARFTGAGDRVMANRVTNQSITAGVFWSAAVMAVAIPLARQFPAWMGLDDLAAAAATQYLTIELCVFPAIMIERVAVACLRGAGDMTSGLVVMAIVNVINMIASYLLAAGVGPLPELGWLGIALGTALGHICGALILLALLVGGRGGFHLSLTGMKPDWPLIRRILRIGVPGGIDVLLVTICHLIYLRIILSLGNVAAAAHGIAIQVEAFGYMPGGAFQISAATMAGQYLGARDPARARRSTIHACIAASAIMAAAGACFYFAATPLAEFFLRPEHSQDVVPLAAELLQLVAYAMVPLALMMVLVGALRGAGDTRWPLVLNLLGIVVLRVPLAMYLAHDEIAVPLVGQIQGAGLGVVGAWYAAITDIVVRCLLLMARFQHEGWQKTEV
jgi:putative MATE family efflux protein